MGIREDYKQAVQLAKNEQYREALALIEPYKANEKVKPLYERLRASIAPEPTKARAKTNWLLLSGVALATLVIGLAIGFFAGQASVDRFDNTSDESVITAGIELCLQATDASASSCRTIIEGSWRLYRANTLACYSDYTDLPSYTSRDFMDCVVAVSD